jgi:thiol:disulfide interchange protein DsbD
MGERDDGALVLFSGGQDSATCLAWALERFGRVETIGFDYGQRHRVELACRNAVRAGILAGFPGWAARLGEAGVDAGRWLAGAALVAALALLPILTRSPPPATLAPTAAEAWSAERVAALQAAGKPVFVNLTAAWCITCKLNERLVLRTAAVQAAFARRGVATLTGDWTQGDPAIGALLRENGREGVPLYLLYPAGGGSPQLLPQVLTEGIIRRAIGEAG